MPPKADLRQCPVALKSAKAVSAVIRNREPLSLFPHQFKSLISSYFCLQVPKRIASVLKATPTAIPKATPILILFIAAPAAVPAIIPNAIIGPQIK